MIEIKRGEAKKREALSAATGGPQEREEARGGIPPPSSPTGPTEAHRGPETGTRGTGSPPPSPDMLEAWREAFRIFSRYSPAIRAAAATDGEMNEGACALFAEALQRVVKMAAIGGDAQIIALRVYDMLGDVWQEARKGCGNDKQESNGAATGSATNPVDGLQG